MTAQDNNILRGQKMVNKILQAAITERNNRGYRENLGYDLYPKLETWLHKHDFTYLEECQIRQYFYSQCGNI